MEPMPLLDCAGRRRSPATLSSFHQGHTPPNKGLRYPPDPPSVEEIIAVMRACGSRPEGVRLRAVVVVLWRAGLRISEAIAVAESDLDRRRGAVLVRSGKGGKRREVGMDRWAWEQLDPWLELRAGLPVGPLFCVLRGPTRGRPCSAAGIRSALHHAAAAAGVRRRFAPHQLRHAHAVEMSREGIPLLVIQRQLGHADLAVTSTYLRGIDNTEIIHAVYERSIPMIPASPRLAPGRRPSTSVSRPGEPAPRRARPGSVRHRDPVRPTSPAHWPPSVAAASPRAIAFAENRSPVRMSPPSPKRSRRSLPYDAWKRSCGPRQPLRTSGP